MGLCTSCSLVPQTDAGRKSPDQTCERNASDTGEAHARATPERGPARACVHTEAKTYVRRRRACAYTSAPRRPHPEARPPRCPWLRRLRRARALPRCRCPPCWRCSASPRARASSPSSQTGSSCTPPRPTATDAPPSRGCRGRSQTRGERRQARYVRRRATRAHRARRRHARRKGRPAAVAVAALRCARDATKRPPTHPPT